MRFWFVGFYIILSLDRAHSPCPGELVVKVAEEGFGLGLFG